MRITLHRWLSIPWLLAGQDLQQIEVCGQGMAAAGSLAQRVAQQQGAALIIDYGQDGPYANSLQAILNHAPAHPLESPGHCDLSCRVDFSALRWACTR